jgi:hypothetical protein
METTKRVMRYSARTIRSPSPMSFIARVVLQICHAINATQ